MRTNETELHVTLTPAMEHFNKFANDKRLSGIRINKAMTTPEDVAEVDDQLNYIKSGQFEVPLFFDIKGRQLRVTEVHQWDPYLDISLNHPISVEASSYNPTPVLFKAGADYAGLIALEEDGSRLIFK